MSPSSTHGSEKGGIPQDTTVDVADLVEQPEKEPLEVTDIQTEDEFALNEKSKESASELNGKVKADDGDSKLKPAASGTVAVISVAATVAAVTTGGEENKQPVEETKVVTDSCSSNIPASQATANSKADTTEVTEDSDVKSPESVKSEEEAMVVQAASGESGTAGEREQIASASTPTADDAITFSEEPPSESVPDDKLFTATPEEIPEQGRRPTSASQIVAKEEGGGSRPTSAVLDGTIPTSASPSKEESVPEKEQREETSMSASGTESTRSRPQSSTEQGTETQEVSRPISTTESNNETNRQTTSLEFSEENREISENLTVETNKVEKDESPEVTTAEGADRPASSVQDKEQPTSAAGSVKEEGNLRSVDESITEERSTLADPAVNSIEDLGEANEIRPASIAVSMTEESSRPVSVAELTTQERSRPASSAVDAMEASEQPAGRPPLSDDKLEEGESGLDISEVDTAGTASSRPVSVIESTKENGTRSLSAAQPTTEEQNVAGRNADLMERPITSVPLIADEIEAGGTMPESSEIKTVENSEEIEISLPVGVSESIKEDRSQPANTTEPTTEQESRPVHSVVGNAVSSEEPAENGMVCAVSRGPTSATVTEEEGDGPANATDSTTYEGSRPTSIVRNEVSKEPSGSEQVFDSAQRDGSDQAGVKGPIEEAASRPESASESVKLYEIESTSPVERNTGITEERSENQPLTDACPIKEGENRLADAEVSEIETTCRATSSAVEDVFSVEAGESLTSVKEDSRPGSAVESAKAGNESIGDAESTGKDENKSSAEATKDEEGSSLSSASGPIQEEKGGLINTGDRTEEEESRPVESAGTVTDEGVGQVSDADSIKGDVSKPVCTEVSTKDEGIELAKQESSMQMGAADIANEEEIRQGNTSESMNEVSKTISLPGSTENEDSMTLSAAADDTVPTQPSQSLSASVSGSVMEENVPESSATENVENSAEATGNQPLSDTESKKEGNQVVSSATDQKALTEVQAEYSAQNESEQLPEPKEDVQIARSRAVSSATEQEIGKAGSRPSSAVYSTDTQERTEDGRSTTGIDNDSRPASELLSNGAESEVTKDASEQGFLSSAIGETTERVESPTSAYSEDIPSLTVTEAADDPGSDSEALPSVAENKPVNDENNLATEDADEEMKVVDEIEELNTAATVIRASFGGYQAGETDTSKAEEKQEVNSVFIDALLFLI